MRFQAIFVAGFVILSVIVRNPGHVNKRSGKW